MVCCVQPLVSLGPEEGLSGSSSQGPLVPRTVTQCPAVQSLNWGSCWSGSGFQVTSGLHLKPPMFSVCCGTRLCSQPDKEDRLPRGPGGRRAGPVWLVPLVLRDGGPSDLRQDPVSAAPGPRADSITSLFCLLKGSLPHSGISALLHSGAF